MEDQAVYIRHEEVIHSISDDGQSELLKTIIRSSQSVQSEIRVGLTKRFYLMQY